MRIDYFANRQWSYNSLEKIKIGKDERISKKNISKRFIYCVQQKVGDEKINWNQSSRKIFNFIRALYKNGPCSKKIFLNGKKIYINNASYDPEIQNYIGILYSIFRITEPKMLFKSFYTYVIIEKWDYRGKLPTGIKLI